MCIANAKESQDITILGLGLSECLYKCDPFSNGIGDFISMQVHAMKLSVAVLALNICDGEFKLLPALLV